MPETLLDIERRCCIAACIACHKSAVVWNRRCVCIVIRRGASTIHTRNQISSRSEYADLNSFIITTMLLDIFLIIIVNNLIIVYV
jgi:hypothetical protein